MADLLEQANEIQETLGRSYAVPDEIDEADLEAGAPINHSLLGPKLNPIVLSHHCRARRAINRGIRG